LKTVTSPHKERVQYISVPYNEWGLSSEVRERDFMAVHFSYITKL